MKTGTREFSTIADHTILMRAHEKSLYYSNSLCGVCLGGSVTCLLL